MNLLHIREINKFLGNTGHMTFFINKLLGNTGHMTFFINKFLGNTGHMSFFLISHMFNEILRQCTHYTVCGSRNRAWKNQHQKLEQQSNIASLYI